MNEPPLAPSDELGTRARAELEQGLSAQIEVQYCRVLELAWLRWLAVASLPVWLELHYRLLPGFVSWLAFLLQGGCLAMAAVHGALERRWAGRAARLQLPSPGVTIETVWTPWDELRAALWYGLAVVSSVPWTYAGLGRPLPAILLPHLTAVAWTIVLLLGTAEVLAAVRPFHGTDGDSGASRPPLLSPGPRSSSREGLPRASP